MRWMLVCAVVGCWSEDLVDDTFTREEWELLSTDFRLPEPQRCPSGFNKERCDAAAELGQRLFFDKALSGKIAISDPAAPGALGQAGAIACAACHDSRKPAGQQRRFFVDTRSSPSNVSSGAKYTKHNALSVVNVGYKSSVAARNCTELDADPMLCNKVFSWTGIYDTPGGVLQLANGAAAMNTTPAIMGEVICGNNRYRLLYTIAFDGLPAKCTFPGFDLHGDNEVTSSLALAFEAYVRRIESVDSRFDRYVAGDVVDGRSSTRDVITDVERRGLSVFLREGMCIECHRGPLLSDLRFHNTGVKQEGQNVPAVDIGLGATTMNPLDDGKFLTPPLRHVGQSGPYMHAGQYTTIAEVIEFYRRGGDDPASFSGTKDPRMQRLEIDDEQARNLEAFLGTLTGAEVDAALAEPLP